MRTVIVVIALCSAGCNLTGPKEDLSGIWTARLGEHFSFVGMTLTQDGDIITGRACAVSDAFLLYKEVLVSGDYPNLQFTVTAGQTQPCCLNLAGTRFKGKQDGSKDIVGTLGTMDVRFQRAQTSICP